ncbi:hypothetical protein CRUP_017780 [Coryphaenoides rupestris]|nr:hypothetical protein CRUP_017780 [Coryphaenoides rupestris]
MYKRKKKKIPPRLLCSSGHSGCHSSRLADLDRLDATLRSPRSRQQEYTLISGHFKAEGYPAALMNLGAILHLNGKLQEAEANYLRALHLKPDDAITQSNLRKLWNIMEKQGLRTTGP